MNLGKTARVSRSNCGILGFLTILLLGVEGLAGRPAQAGQTSNKGPSSQNGNALYRQHCQKCHGEDGKGTDARKLFSDIPDFSSKTWQKKVSDAELASSISDGKGTGMPPFNEKLSQEQVQALAAFVRAFAPAPATSGRGNREGPVPAEFAEEFQRLENEMKQLRRQFRELSARSPGGGLPDSSSSSQQVVRGPSQREAPEMPTAPEIFKQYCAKCHGVDGSGSPARGLLPDNPDFTDSSWQARRNDAQLLTSILNGKGTDMPPWSGKISKDLAQSLVPYVRAFATTPKKSVERRQQGASPAEAVEAKPVRGFL